MGCTQDAMGHEDITPIKAQKICLLPGVREGTSREHLENLLPNPFISDMGMLQVSGETNWINPGVKSLGSCCIYSPFVNTKKEYMVRPVEAYIFTILNYENNSHCFLKAPLCIRPSAKCFTFITLFKAHKNPVFKQEMKAHKNWIKIKWFLQICAVRSG